MEKYVRWWWVSRSIEWNKLQKKKKKTIKIIKIDNLFIFFFCVREGSQRLICAELIFVNLLLLQLTQISARRHDPSGRVALTAPYVYLNQQPHHLKHLIYFFVVVVSIACFCIQKEREKCTVCSVVTEMRSLRDLFYIVLYKNTHISLTPCCHSC